ncbi:hypothetical protein Q4543_18730, partial [Salipiger sp. 1_MG-2023]|uniref:hypothetical protein n=1 Tax=Salipiger sp. 1_MG-2023 TaxID=3062665 RepID=UPI0026E16AC3
REEEGNRRAIEGPREEERGLRMRWADQARCRVATMPGRRRGSVAFSKDPREEKVFDLLDHVGPRLAGDNPWEEEWGCRRSSKVSGRRRKTFKRKLSQAS